MIKYIGLLPEILLILNIIFMSVVFIFRDKQTPKTFTTINKYLVSATLIISIVFYNISYHDIWFVNTPYTTVFKSAMFLIFLLISPLVGKWFLSKNYSSYEYYLYTNLMMLGFSVALSSRHLIVLSLSLILSYISGALLKKMQENTIDNKGVLTGFILKTMIVSFMLFIATFILYNHSKSFAYSDLLLFYKTTAVGKIDIIAVSMLLSVLMIMLGAVPFHFDRFQVIKDSILPVATILAIIPPIIAVGLIVMMFHDVFVSFSQNISVIMFWCGVLSIFFGGIGTGSVSNIRQVFGCVGLFYKGIVLLLLSYFNIASIQSGIVYFIIYIISALGMYSCLYGIKSHGEYLSELEEFSGMYTTRPYISSALLIFSVSLLGIPPFWGLLGNFKVVNNLLDQHSYYILLYISVMLVFLAYGLLKVIKILYFNKHQHSFDRVDKGVYVSLIFYVGIMLAIIINPKYILHDIENFISYLLS